jgi:HTH-type transcriptional regulator, glycine betaine synthesis regulator
MAEAKHPSSRREFVETAGRLCQRLGLPRSTGQIYGLLYLSSRPLTLDDIAELLSISKASASTGTRQLVGWQALKQVWVPGDRRDHFEAVGDLGELIRVAYDKFFRPKFDRSVGKLEHLLAALETDRKDGALTKEDYAFCKERLVQLRTLQNRLQKLLPLAEKFL